MRTFILATIFRQEPVLFSFQYLFKITNIGLVEKISWSQTCLSLLNKNKLLRCKERLVYNKKKLKSLKMQQHTPL